MSARVEAAAKAVYGEIGEWYPLEGVLNLDQHAATLAAEALSAADAAIIPEELSGVLAGAYGRYQDDDETTDSVFIYMARAVIAVLRDQDAV